MKWEEMVNTWEPLSASVNPGLLDARLMSHWAAQIVATFGTTCIAPRPDDSHTSMVWLPAPRLLAGERSEGGLRVGLDIEDLALVRLGAGDEVLSAYALPGRTLDDAFRWLADMVRAADRKRPVSIRRPTYEMPDHPAGSGETFDGSDRKALAELARWYANAARIFTTVADENPDASPVRCWPHHFDIATLVLFDPDEPDSEKARSLGVGMSPGDSSCLEPYFYVNPWPRPEVVQPPELDGDGSWHLEDWFGAVLPASRLASSVDPRDQASQVGAFVASAMTAGRALLDL
jgi:hypothetical protein